LIKDLLGLKLEKDDKAEELIRSKFQNVIAEIFAKTGKVDLINKIKTKREFIVLFLGINGLKNNTGGGNHVSSSTLLLTDSPCYDLYNILSAPLYLNNRSSIFVDALIKYQSRSFFIF